MNIKTILLLPTLVISVPSCNPGYFRYLFPLIYFHDDNIITLDYRGESWNGLIGVQYYCFEQHNIPYDEFFCAVGSFNNDQVVCFSYLKTGEYYIDFYKVMNNSITSVYSGKFENEYYFSPEYFKVCQSFDGSKFIFSSVAFSNPLCTMISKAFLFEIDKTTFETNVYTENFKEYCYYDEFHINDDFVFPNTFSFNAWDTSMFDFENAVNVEKMHRKVKEKPLCKVICCDDNFYLNVITTDSYYDGNKETISLYKINQENLELTLLSEKQPFYPTCVILKEQNDISDSGNDNI